MLTKTSKAGLMATATKSLERVPDAELMLRVRRGNQFAFGELYRRYNRRLLDFFYGMSRDATEAEDLTHETFMRIWKVRGKYMATGSFPAYVFTFARNIWLEHVRRSRKQWRLGIRTSLDDSYMALATGASECPHETASRSELAARIRTALDLLPDEQRMVFVMRAVEGLSIGDIAEVMQCPQNTVRSRKLLAIKTLRESLRSLMAS